MKLALISLAVVHLVLAAVAARAHEGDDPLLSKVMINRLESQAQDQSSPEVLSAQAWVGKDLNKVWLKTEVERDAGKTQDAELLVYYDRAVSPFWDLQLGLRQDIQPEPSRTWAAIGLQGLAPYFLDVEATVFINDQGDTGARLEVEYEALLTQRWVLIPRIEMNAFGQKAPQWQQGAGLSKLDAGLRLHYEICREFAPYLGIAWHQGYGGTANYQREAGGHTSEAFAVLGARMWF